MRQELTSEGVEHEARQRQHLDESLAAFGLYLETPAPLLPERCFHLWPEHVPVFRLWKAVQTQWVFSGLGVVTGLHYAGVWTVIDRVCKGPARKRAQLFRDLQVMEAAALDEWAERRQHGSRTQ